MYTEGKYKVRSLKETRFEIAKEIAHEWYFELRGKQKSGTPVHGLKFKDVIQDYLNYQNVLVKGGEMSESSAKDYQRRLSGGPGHDDAVSGRTHRALHKRRRIARRNFDVLRYLGRPRRCASGRIF